MKNIKELLVITRDQIERYFNMGQMVDGLCLMPHALYTSRLITRGECLNLNMYLHVHLPFREHDDYCWKAGKVKPRIKWLDKQISKTGGIV